MTRRTFIQRLSRRALTAAAAWTIGGPSALPLMAETAIGADASNDTYQPLNGRSLMDLALSRTHHGGNRFSNPFTREKKGSFWPVMRWKLFSPNHFSGYYKDEPSLTVQPDWPRLSAHKGLSVTFVKHATILIKDGPDTFLIDPVFGPIFPFIQDFSPLAGDLDEMPRPTRVLITHGHYDHLDLASLTRLGTDTEIISPLGYDTEFSELGMRRRHTMDWFDNLRVEGSDITFLPCNHWTMRNPLIGPNRSLWGSYLIRTRQGASIYVSGDTGYFDGFQQIGQLFDIDLAIINLGAYEPRWFMAGSHMNPAETVRAFTELGARRLMITHWGTFRLGDEPVHFPPMDIQREMTANGHSDRLLAVSHGETVFL
ncbi:MAG: MBL fold metallo-hydrolase [Pseudomonadota bacterium]